MAVEQVDPVTGERWRRIDPLVTKPSFHGFLVLLSLVSGWLLWWLSDTGTAALSSEGAVRNFELARSLAEGHGYALPNANGTYVPAVFPPPLYPALLALVMLFLGTTDPVQVLDPLRFVNLLLYFSSIVLAYFYFASYKLKPPYPQLLMLLFTIAPITLLAANHLTETLLYITLSLAAMVSFNRVFANAGPGRIPPRPMVTGTASLVGLAVSAHTAGLALLGAYLIQVGRFLGPRRLLWNVLLFAILIVPWGLRSFYYDEVANNAAFRAQNPTYEEQLNSDPEIEENGEQALALLSYSALGAEPITEAQAANQDWLDRLLSFQLPLSQWHWLHWLIGFVLLLGLFHAFVVNTGLAPLYGTLFVLGTVLYHSTPQLPNPAPIFPLILLFLFDGLALMANRLGFLKRPIQAVVLPVVVGVIVIHSAGYFMTHLGQYGTERSFINIPAYTGQEPAIALSSIASDNTGVDAPVTSRPLTPQQQQAERRLQRTIKRAPSAFNQPRSVRKTSPQVASVQGALAPTPPPAASEFAAPSDRFVQQNGQAAGGAAPISDASRKGNFFQRSRQALASAGQSARGGLSRFRDRLLQRRSTVSTQPATTPQLSSTARAVARSAPPVEGVEAVPTPKPAVSERLAPPSLPSAYRKVIPFLQAETGASSRVMTTQPNLIRVFSKRPTVLYPAVAVPEVMIQPVINSEYLVEEVGSRASEEVVAPLRARYPRRFELAFVDPAAQTRVWRILPQEAG